jgi:hypothetical protein
VHHSVCVCAEFQDARSSHTIGCSWLKHCCWTDTSFLTRNALLAWPGLRVAGVRLPDEEPCWTHGTVNVIKH